MANAIVATVFMSAGCADDAAKVVEVRGIAKYEDGSPLTGGWVTFRSQQPPEHLTARGKIGLDGKFELTTYAEGDGAVLGQHDVVVTLPLGGDREGRAEQPKIADRYGSYDTSGLAFEVVEDPSKNVFDIELEQARRP